ncbi:MAG: FMN-dependent NADH-azoreductase [Azospirillaceae bacterium]|nr:FMN-dependent NADH-azoreductase [Azospirillaceae bacterium]
MSRILVVQSSPNLGASLSRALSNAFVDRFVARHAGTTVVTRDLVAEAIPHLSEDRLQALSAAPEALTPAQQAAVALSDRLIDEIRDADMIVIGVPCYNLSIPSSLKAWIDQIVIPNRSFRYTEAGPVGLMTGKKVYIFITSGSVYSQGPEKPHDFALPLLQGILTFIGLSDMTVVRAEGMGAMPDQAARIVAQARAEAERLAD